MTKIALITGITGQDGSNLTRFLLSKDYTVHGIIRRSSYFNTQRIDDLYEQYNGSRLFLYYGDLGDANSLEKIIREVKPNELYHLGCQSHVRTSFDIPIYTFDIAATGTLRVLEAVKNTKPDIKIYNACSSEMFGKVVEIPQKETTPFHPRSPYGCAKVASYWLSKNYRESYNMFCTNGILFNHEGEYRHETFVTRKITKAACKIKLGMQQKLFLGNLNAKRDWGSSADFVRGMWMMLQHHEPNDFVLATGESHSVREFCSMAFEYLGMNYENYVKIDPKYFRPAEVDILLGDYSKAKQILGWKPKIKFKDLVVKMVDFDMKNLRGSGS